MNLGGVEALLLHESFGAMRRALAFPADAVNVDVVAHDMRDIYRHLLVRKRRKADAPAPVDHAHGVVYSAGRRRAFDNIVDAPAAVELFYFCNDVGSLADIDDSVGAEFEADF